MEGLSSSDVALLSGRDKRRLYHSGEDEAMLGNTADAHISD